MLLLIDLANAVMQISAAFSGGSAIAVLGGGMLFCRYTGAGRRNFITGLTVLASACFFVLTKYAIAPDEHTHTAALLSRNLSVHL